MNFSSAFFWWLVIGGVTGWFASLVVSTGARQYLYVDVFFGVMGALAASMTVAKLLPPSASYYVLAISLPTAFIGACAGVALWRLVTLRRVPVVARRERP